MVHSMTAFARVEKAGAQGTLSWELRSVNSRYLEPHLRLPESFRDLEGAVREALRQGISRGKLECTLRFTEETTGKPLQVDRDRAAQLVAAAETIAGLIKQPAALNPLEVLAWPGVLVADAADPQALNAEALALFKPGPEGTQGRPRARRRRAGAPDQRAVDVDRSRRGDPARTGTADARHPTPEGPRPLYRHESRPRPDAPGTGNGPARAEERRGRRTRPPEHPYP